MPIRKIETGHIHVERGMEMALIPPRLHKGDKIGIVSPSTPALPELQDQWDHGVAFLEKLGFEVVAGKHVRSTSWGYAASPQEKAEDIHRMFADSSIKAIICSQGGATANGCLGYLDWGLIRTHPKIFLGISDITVLLNAIYRQTGLVTFHGNDLLWGFGRETSQYDQDEFISRLVDGWIGKIPPNGDRQTVRSGSATGMLLGGNLHCLLKLAGTPYFPNFERAVLFVEAIGITPEACDHLFNQLKQMGIFDRIHGAIVGYIDGLQNNDKALFQMEDILLRVTPEYHFPILKVNDFGHNNPNTVLPVGGQVKMDADQRTIEILAPCVI
jgi:muramoyltetrapeptide carboxypeptidase